MQFSQVIPKDITKLANFSVPGQLFICTCIVLIIFAILALAFMIFWIYRTFKGYSNTDYIADYEVKIEAEKTMKKIALEEESPEDVIQLLSNRNCLWTSAELLADMRADFWSFGHYLLLLLSMLELLAVALWKLQPLQFLCSCF